MIGLLVCLLVCLFVCLFVWLVLCVILFFLVVCLFCCLFDCFACFLVVACLLPFLVACLNACIDWNYLHWPMLPGVAGTNHSLLQVYIMSHFKPNSSLARMIITSAVASEMLHAESACAMYIDHVLRLQDSFAWNVYATHTHTQHMHTCTLAYMHRLFSYLPFQGQLVNEQEGLARAGECCRVQAPGLLTMTSRISQGMV